MVKITLEDLKCYTRKTPFDVKLESSRGGTKHQARYENIQKTQLNGRLCILLHQQQY